MKLTIRKNELTKSACTIISVFCGFIFILNSKAVTEAFVFSLNNSLNEVVPSVFPMLVITYFFLGTGFSKSLKKFIGKFTAPLFGLSGNTAEIILTGLLGGYNTAIKSAVKKLSSDEISTEEAKRLSLFFTCPGVSFCICICGLSVYSDIKAGIILLSANILSCLITASLYNIFRKNKISDTVVNKSYNISSAFVDAVASSATAVMGIISWICVFSVIIAALNIYIPFHSINTILSLTGEISSAIIFAKNNFSLGITAFCLSFGGLCIFFQQLPDIIAIGISPVYYLVVRLIQAVLCSVIAKFLFILFPVSIGVSADYPVFIPSRTSIPGSVALIIMGIILLNSLKTAKTQLIHQNIKNYYNK